MVFAILLDDSSSIRKTEEEKREEKELAEKVNATLAEEEEKERREEEEKKKLQDQGKKGQGQEKERKTSSTEKVECLDEASSTPNCTCPEVRPCPKEKDCGPCEICKSSEECPPVKDCEPCEECGSCPPVKPCLPCSSNYTSVQPPSGPGCSADMPTVVAMAVGAAASLVVTGVAAAIGLLLRYASPMVSGFIFLATIIIVWYLSSQYPETARELGGRAATLLREAAVALGHRLMEALRHHREQVSFPIKPYLFLRMSSMFPKVCTKIFYVPENNF